ncbi:MAG: septum formation initiator family protein [Peptococcaceae bacterium]|nr:septum formation initiator family protein [Peptococcaceae bacterium]
MANKKAAIRKRRKRPNILLIILTTISLVLAGSWSWQLIKIDQSMERQLSYLREQKRILIAQNEKLHKDIEKLNTPSYIEQLAREKLGLVRKGEILIAPKADE